jgi:hypothetical protein
MARCEERSSEQHKTNCISCDDLALMLNLFVMYHIQFSKLSRYWNFAQIIIIIMVMQKEKSVQQKSRFL